MKQPKISVIIITFIATLACAFWLCSARSELVPAFDARQEVLESGATVTGTASYVKHKGLMNWGVRYAELEYAVDGKTYHSEVRFAQNYRKLPGEADAQGRYPVVIHYDENEPESAAIECAQKGWKMARFSLLFIIILLFLYAALMLLGLVVLGKEKYVPYKMSRF